MNRSSYFTVLKIYAPLQSQLLGQVDANASQIGTKFGIIQNGKVNRVNI
jgi:hypothetical protein